MHAGKKIATAYAKEKRTTKKLESLVDDQGLELKLV